VVALLSFVASGLHGLAYWNVSEGGPSEWFGKKRGHHDRDRRDDHDEGNMVLTGMYGLSFQLFPVHAGKLEVYGDQRKSFVIVLHSICQLLPYHCPFVVSAAYCSRRWPP
jgi:hypothetical protein